MLSVKKVYMIKDVASTLKISYVRAHYYLKRLVKKGFLIKEIHFFEKEKISKTSRYRSSSIFLNEEGYKIAIAVLEDHLIKKYNF